MVRLFVYGTLKIGFRNYKILEDRSAYLGWHKTPEIYTLKDLGYFPGLELNGSHSIQGEVYQLGDDVLKDVDFLENYPHMYDRMEIETMWGPAWMYYISPKSAWYGRGNDKIIEDGIWNKDAIAGMC